MATAKEKKPAAAKAKPATAAPDPQPEKVKTYALGSSADTLELAKDVKRFIDENKLYQQIQEKSFVNVEGWQYAGARLGLFPVCERSVMLARENELAYECFVNIKDIKTGEVVSTGFAVCSNKENGKKFYQEFAIASMAQTRAIGKGFRNLLAWIIRAAGYEPTPAEEMDNGSFIAPEVKETGSPAKAEKTAKTAAPAPQNQTAGTTPPAKPESAPEPPKITPPQMLQGSKEWFDDQVNAEEELERIAASCDLQAVEKWLVNFRTKKAHRAKLEELYISIKSNLCKPEPVDTRPTKTDAEFKELLAELEGRSDLDGVEKAIRDLKMRPAVFKAFNELKAKLEALFNEIPEKSSSAKKTGKATEKTEEVSDGYATAAQKAEIVQLCTSEVLPRTLKTDVLLGINKLTVAAAASKIEQLKKAIAKATK